MNPHFLNVDLEITSRLRLDPLLAEIGKRLCVLHAGRVRGRNILILESCKSHPGPDAAVKALCLVIERLSPASKRLWKTARKEFDVGYDLYPSERSARVILRRDTLERITSLGANLTLTLYRADDPNLRPTKLIATNPAMRIELQAGHYLRGSFGPER